jgi:glycerol-3-phosphate dehydrogenase (NAD(P)+)
MSLSVLGAGAFGTALAVALSANGPVHLWGREIGWSRENPRLPGVALPETITVTGDLEDACRAETLLLALPAQALRGFLETHHAALDAKVLVNTAKGIDLTTLTGPAALIGAACPRATVVTLTGPSFAADIARGLPTALTLACASAETGEALQQAIITRGFAEMTRLALHLGARPETLAGHSGLGDLTLTCTSPQSRNFRFGQALGAKQDFDTTTTVEGVATARAVTALAQKRGEDMPIAAMVAALAQGHVSVEKAAEMLMNRPLKEE